MSNHPPACWDDHTCRPALDSEMDSAFGLGFALGYRTAVEATLEEGTTIADTEEMWEQALKDPSRVFKDEILRPGESVTFSASANRGVGVPVIPVQMFWNGEVWRFGDNDPDAGF